MCNIIHRKYNQPKFALELVLINQITFSHLWCLHKHCGVVGSVV